MCNVFGTYQNGWENPVLAGLYEEAGEAWEYLYYAEYDINGDGRMDYVAVHGNLDNAMEENGFCGEDIWCLSKDGIYEREEISNTALVQTGFQLLYNDTEERVRIEIKGREGNPDFYQVILTDRKRVLLSYGKQTCTAWDGNDDGYEDIFYYAVYSEWGEEVERTDITGLSWEETQVLLEGKYPQFNFWRQG